VITKLVRALPTVAVILVGIGLYQAPEWIHATHHAKVKMALIIIGVWLAATVAAYVVTRQKQQQPQRPYSYRTSGR